MPRTPANFGGPLVETEYQLFYDEYGAIPDEYGSLVYYDGGFYARDEYGAFNLRGISKSEHETLRQLIHFVETNSPGNGFGNGPYYCETNYTSSVFPINETWYETNAKVKKICRWEGTYNANKTFATEKWIVYKSDGINPAADATDTISYSGMAETSRSRTIVVY